jgi:hypothetical protein
MMIPFGREEYDMKLNIERVCRTVNNHEVIDLHIHNGRIWGFVKGFGCYWWTLAGAAQDTALDLVESPQVNAADLPWQYLPYDWIAFDINHESWVNFEREPSPSRDGHWVSAGGERYVLPSFLLMPAIRMNEWRLTKCARPRGAHRERSEEPTIIRRA